MTKAAENHSNTEISTLTAKEIQQLVMEAAQYQSIRPEKALQICNKIISALESNPDLPIPVHELRSEIYLIQGNTHQNLCDHQKAMESLYYSLEAEKDGKNNLEIGERLILIAKTQTHLKNYSEALSLIYRAIEIAQEIEDKFLEGLALNTLGMVYLDLSEPFKGLSYIQQGHDILEDSATPESVEIAYPNLCLAYLKMGVLEKALKFGKMAVKSNRGQGNFKQMSISLIYLGDVYQAKEKDQDALEAYQKGLEVSRKYNYQCESSLALCKIGAILLAQKQYDGAQKHIEESLRLTKSFSNHPNYAECHRLLAEMFTQQKKFQQALRHHQLYHTSMSQQYERDLASRVKVLDQAYDLETANKISDALKEQNDALREEIRKRKQVQAELEQISRLDGLTGIFNRRYFYELAGREYKKSLRYGHPLAAIMVDIDHFKEVNDSHGHAIGDQVLIEVAQRIQAGVRNVDVVGRYGGEEFVVLLPETELEDAKAMAKRIWHKLTDRPMIANHLSIPVKASVGVASCHPESKVSLDVLIDRADQALYQAKELGRNRIETFPS